MVDPGSLNSTLAHAIVRFAQLVDIPWLLYADGDDEGRRAVQALFAAVRADDDERRQCLVWVNGEYGGDIEQMVLDFDRDLCRGAVAAVRPDLIDLEIERAMDRCKGSLWPTAARLLIERHPDPGTWPGSVRTVVERLSKRLGPEDDGDDHHD